MTKNTSGHTLTKKQKIQLAEVQHAKSKAGDISPDTSTGGSDANSGPAQNAAPISAETPPGNPTTSVTAPRVPPAPKP